MYFIHIMLRVIKYDKQNRIKINIISSLTGLNLPFVELAYYSQ